MDSKEIASNIILGVFLLYLVAAVLRIGTRYKATALELVLACAILVVASIVVPVLLGASVR